MGKMLEALKPVFVVGTSKSGTSFLLSLFDSHPQSITLFETAVYAFPEKRFNEQKDLLASVENYFTPRFRNLHLGKNVTKDNFLAEAGQRLSPDSPGSISKSLLYAFLSVVLNNHGQESAQQVTHFIEKTPQHYKYVDKIIADFPDAKIIHVLRDPRDNYLSLKRRVRDRKSSQCKNLNYHPINFISSELLASLNAAYENANRFGDQYRILFYEDLIFNGESIMRGLASWLGLAWHEVLLIPSIDGELWRGNSTVSDLRDRLKPFDTRTVGRWKNELSRREISLMEYIIKCYKLEQKYPLTGNRYVLDLVWGLSFPFQDELKKESKRIGGVKLLPKLLISLGWSFMKKRFSIYSHLQSRLSNYDNKLTQVSFTP